jgi:hypothetical protein
MPASAHLQPHTAAVFVDCVGSGLIANMGDGAAHGPEDKLAAAELTSPVVEDLDPAECALQIAA